MAMKNATDRFFIDTNNPNEYGAISLTVMASMALSIESKAIYAYICARAGKGNSAFPSIERICTELGISKQRFLKHRKPLLDSGLLIIEHPEREGNRNQSNIYRLPMHAQATLSSSRPFPPGERVPCAPHPFTGDAGDGTADFDRSQNVTGQTFDRSQNVSGQNPDRSQNVTGQNRSASEFSQCADRVGFDRSQNVTTNTDGWLDKSNQPIQDAGKDTREGADESFNELCRLSVNRNLLRNAKGIAETRAAYDKLRERFTADQIKDAWQATLSACDQRGTDAQFYPQLRKWLATDAESRIARCAKQSKSTRKRAKSQAETAEEQRIAVSARLEEGSPAFRELLHESRALRERFNTLKGNKRWGEEGAQIIEEHKQIAIRIDQAIDAEIARMEKEAAHV